MRRTYRSKKETGGALDHKEAIQALDEKSSAFDAFYIQNIKQTKRELSCIGSSSHYGAATNKVRKRKYVKRIVKDVEPSVENSSCHSVFLTPDKSMRVNKAQDLFDQLLNSSSTRQSDSQGNSLSNIGRFPKQEGKTYARRKLAKVKKFNCSSSDSVESDKENSNEDFASQNLTDLRSYELVIEKEKRPSPKYLDESINKIVKNLSVLNCNNIHRNNSSCSAKKTYNNIKHRLTTTVESPLNSPLCSTPFKEKYRSQSIFKFSPIAFGKNDESEDCVTIVEENCNDSVVFVCKEQELKKIKEKDISFNDENPPSPVIHLSTNKFSHSKTSKTSSTNSETQVNSLHSEVIEKDIVQDVSNNVITEVSCIEISDFQTTEAEPFLGFSNVDSLKNKSNTSHKEENNSIPSGKGNIDNGSDDIFEDSISFVKSVHHDDDINELKNNDTLSETQDDNSENDSSYGTCNSDQSFQYDDIKTIKVPVVILERLNDSILVKYLDKANESDVVNTSKQSVRENSVRSENHDTSSEIDSDDYASFEASRSSKNSSTQSSNIEESDCEILSDDKNSDGDPADSIISNEIEFNCSNEEERCISFVTTRRRNEVANDSLLCGFNYSLQSTSSTDCDKTVLSNNDCTKVQASLSPNLEIDSNTKTEEGLNVTDVDEKQMDTELKGDNNTSKETRISRITTRKSAKLLRDSNIDNNIMEQSVRSTIDEGKPGIVLQPGKKWERSLSIYRRMTMMNDQFEQTILDDDEFSNKGRKYRQSVISTMELQDKGSLHNESIFSRRSTFVSKPCRSTIRIIKEPNSSRLSLCTTAVSDGLGGFLNEVCDDTIIELSKLSIADSEHEVTVIDHFHDTSSRVSTARDYVLRRCHQTDTILFDECYPETVLKNCRKIGEGVYGEVFLWRAGDGRVRVMKIVPIAGTTKVNGEHQKDFQEIISEIVIAMELSALRAPIDEIQREFDEGKSIDALDLHSVENATDVFNQVLAVRCVYGAYPSRLLDLWELFDECNGSENDTPAILPVDQQYIVLELANAGQDLESYEFNSAEQAHALFLQVAFGLAVGEEAFQFEHRDLHWGNVLIAPTDQKFATFVLRGRAHRVARCGVAATIIDYSLSRLSLPLASAGDAAALYNDLAADDGLFDAVGDYQFQVYRLMRDKLGNDWKNFEPYTNILWLHYTVDKMITALRYKRTNTKIHKHYIAKLKGIKNRLLEYGSAAQFVLTDNEF